MAVVIAHVRKGSGAETNWNVDALIYDYKMHRDPRAERRAWCKTHAAFTFEGLDD